MLEGRADSVQAASGADRVAAHHGHLFDHDDLRAEIVRGDGGDEAGRTGADDDGVVFGRGGGLGLGGRGESGDAGGGAEERTRDEVESLTHDHSSPAGTLAPTV